MRMNPIPRRGPWRNPWPEGIDNGVYVAGDLPFGAVGYVPSSGTFFFMQPDDWDRTAHDRKLATPLRATRAQAAGLTRRIIQLRMTNSRTRGPVTRGLLWICGSIAAFVTAFWTVTATADLALSVGAYGTPGTYKVESCYDTNHRRNRSDYDCHGYFTPDGGMLTTPPTCASRTPDTTTRTAPSSTRGRGSSRTRFSGSASGESRASCGNSALPQPSSAGSHTLQSVHPSRANQTGIGSLHDVRRRPVV